jgi:hypothetical protein
MKLIPWDSVLPENSVVAQLFKEFRNFILTEGLLPC